VKFAFSCLWLVYLTHLQAQRPESDTIRLNDIRILASHNSYKTKPDPRVLSFLNRFKKRLGPDLDPIQLDYGHPRLNEQLDVFHIRGFELDVCPDKKGGHYKKRRINAFVWGLRQRTKNPEMKLPGFKILHIADVDYSTNYLTLSQALKELKDWSDSNANHTPLFVNIEIKRDAPGDHSKFLRFIGFKKAPKVTAADLDELDSEILKHFPKEGKQLLSPMEFRGTFHSVKERIEKTGWPMLSECLGKIIFILDGDVNGMYQEDLEKQKDRPMFVYGAPELPETAFVIRNEPRENQSDIAALTEKYMVRTRTDAGTIEARNHDHTRFQAALQSKAQILSTDFYRNDPSIGDFCIDLKPFLRAAHPGTFIRE
jgi:hypothetical protein